MRLVISGDVQGVGLRMWVQAAARNLELTGWVKNRRDETVEVVAEGETEKLKELVVLCHRGPEVAWVEHVEEIWSEARDEFSTFEVIL